MELPLVLIRCGALLLMVLAGCESERDPAREGDSALFADCVDLDQDGVFHPCLECSSDQSSGCVDTIFLLRARNEVVLQPSIFQSLSFPPEERLVNELPCSLIRSFTLAQPELPSRVRLSQGNQALEWAQDGRTISENAAATVEFNPRKPVQLTFLDQTTRLEVVPPPLPSATTQAQAVACARMMTSMQILTPVDFAAPGSYLFIGGSRTLPSASSETMVAFYVVDGTLSEASVDLPLLVSEQRISAQSVRCAVTAFQSDSVYLDPNRLELKVDATAEGQNAVTSPVQETRQPEVSFFNGTDDGVEYLTRNVQQWGQPDTLQFTRSGPMGMDYYSESLVCPIDPETVSFRLNPEEVFPVWGGDAPPTRIGRLLWNIVDEPLYDHPQMRRRSTLSVQTNF